MRTRQQTKKAVGYVMVSREGQATQGVSMEAWALANDYRILKEAASHGEAKGHAEGFGSICKTDQAHARQAAEESPT